MKILYKNKSFNYIDALITPKKKKKNQHILLVINQLAFIKLIFKLTFPRICTFCHVATPTVSQELIYNYKGYIPFKFCTNDVLPICHVFCVSFNHVIIFSVHTCRNLQILQIQGGHRCHGNRSHDTTRTR